MTQPAAAVTERWKINPVGVALAIAGAVAMVIAIFLPRVESSAFTLGGIQENTLIQSGDGWIFIGLAIGIAGAVYRSYTQGVKSWLVLVLGLIAIGVAYYNGTNEEALTLYRLDVNGDPDYSNEVNASPGVGIYVAGVGGLLALVGGWQMRRDAEPHAAAPPRAAGAASPMPPPVAGTNAMPPPSSAPMKKCPDCAEVVLADARVCRYCGFRFDADTAAWSWPGNA